MDLTQLEGKAVLIKKKKNTDYALGHGGTQNSFLQYLEKAIKFDVRATVN